VTREVRRRNQNPTAGHPVAHPRGERSESDRIIPRGVERNQLAAGHKILPQETHPQLHSLRSCVAVNASDHLLDLHQVKGSVERNRASE
jgi:hypothetical protein